jgi:tripartite-type tricarboxylate transporter receptor subunit TctC
MLNIPRRQFLRLAAGAGAMSAISRTAGAQAYPSHPITIIVPTGAGGPQDVVARIVVEGMRASLGQPLIIENVSGAAGILGIARVARAAPNGYTLAFTTSFTSHVVQAVTHALPYDVVSDFEPVSLVADAPQLMSARKTLPARDLKGLIEWLKENPDKASLGQTGPGSPAHVTGILFQKQTGTRFQFANYRSAGQAMQDVVAGHIDLMFTSPTIAVEHIRVGSIKAYAVTAKHRFGVTPEVPTVDEAGLPGFYAAPWYAVWAPKATPQDVIGKVNAAVMGALVDPTVRKRLTDLGLHIFPPEQQTPEALRAFQKAEIERWWPILKEAGIKGE